MLRKSWIAAMAVLGLVACNSGDDAAPAASQTSEAPAGGEVDLSEVASYELTMEKVDQLFAVQRNLAVAMKDMSPAEREAMEISGDASDSMDETISRMESNPAMRKALDDADMSAREFMTGTAALMQAGMAGAILEMRPNDNADSLVREMHGSMANVEFVREHQAEIQQKQEALQAEMRAMGVDDADTE